MKKYFVLTMLCVLGFAMNVSAQYDDPPKKSNTAQKIVDGLHGVKGHCVKEDGTSGKWHPTKMTETRSNAQTNSRSKSNSSGNSENWKSEMSLTGPKGGLDAGRSNSRSSSSNESSTESGSVSYEYECR